MPNPTCTSVDLCADFLKAARKVIDDAERIRTSTRPEGGYCAMPDTCGPTVWAVLHGIAEAMRDEVCEHCGAEAVKLMHGLHDVVNMKLGKAVKYPKDLALLRSMAEGLEAHHMQSRVDEDFDPDQYGSRCRAKDNGQFVIKFACEEIEPVKYRKRGRTDRNDPFAVAERERMNELRRSQEPYRGEQESHMNQPIGIPGNLPTDREVGAALVPCGGDLCLGPMSDGYSRYGVNIPLPPDAQGTWHTHPGGKAELSSMDLAELRRLYPQGGTGCVTVPETGETSCRRI